MAVAVAFGQDFDGRGRRAGPPCPHLACTDAAHQEFVANRHRLTPEVNAAVIESVRSE
jgi:hypothetical protein